jgi:hypothetical protein
MSAGDPSLAQHELPMFVKASRNASDSSSCNPWSSPKLRPLRALGSAVSDID